MTNEEQVKHWSAFMAAAMTAGDPEEAAEAADQALGLLLERKTAWAEKHRLAQSLNLWRATTVMVPFPDGPKWSLQKRPLDGFIEAAPMDVEKAKSLAQAMVDLEAYRSSPPDHTQSSVSRLLDFEEYHRPVRALAKSFRFEVHMEPKE